MAQVNTKPRVSRHGTGTKESRRRPVDSTISGDRDKNLGKPKQPEFSRLLEEEPAAKKETFGDMQRVFLKKSADC